jgi:ketosteroid isomerase-like protein
MARRLEQLHSALGESEVATAKAIVKDLPSTVDSVKTFPAGRLIMTAILSALFGAGIMWLGAPHPQPTAAPAPLTLAAPPTVAPTTSNPVLTAPATAEVSDKTQVGELLDTWRNAWAQRDIASYLDTYSQQFTPIDGSTRDAWVAARTKKLSAGAPIDIQIRELGIERLNADQFKVTFLQDYASGNYREMARTKVLLIIRENGEWKIAKEWMTENKLAM